MCVCGTDLMSWSVLSSTVVSLNVFIITAGGYGQRWTAAAAYSYPASVAVVRRTHRLCVHRLLALQLALWTHRLYPGRLV